MFLSKVWSFKAFRSWACTTFFVYASSNVPPLLVHRVTPWRLHHCNFLGHIARLMRKNQKKAGKRMERDKNRRKICHLPSDPTINLDTVCSLFSYGPNLLHFFFAPFVTPRPCFHIRATGANGAMARKGENK